MRNRTRCNFYLQLNLPGFVAKLAKWSIPWHRSSLPASLFVFYYVPMLYIGMLKKYKMKLTHWGLKLGSNREAGGSDFWCVKTVYFSVFFPILFEIGSVKWTQLGTLYKRIYICICDICAYDIFEYTVYIFIYLYVHFCFMWYQIRIHQLRLCLLHTFC